MHDTNSSNDAAADETDEKYSGASRNPFTLRLLPKQREFLDRLQAQWGVASHAAVIRRLIDEYQIMHTENKGLTRRVRHLENRMRDAESRLAQVEHKVTLHQR